MSNNRPLRGAKQIAYELGCSVSTVYRLAKSGKAPIIKGCSGGRTSPLIVERKTLSTAKRKFGD